MASKAGLARHHQTDPRKHTSTPTSLKRPISLRTAKALHSGPTGYSEAGPYSARLSLRLTV